MCDPSVRRLKRAEDDKIELNRKMNANLEAQAQALFKSWFVDFAPWGGKGLRGGRVPARAKMAARCLCLVSRFP